MVNGRTFSGGRAGHTHAGMACLLVWLAGAMLVSWSQAGASLTHQPSLPHTKVLMIDYKYTNTPEELDFLATHADLVIGGTLEGHGDSPGLAYANYYCMYVGNEEYESARQWAAQHGVDFEAFFIHYAVETEAKFGSETHVLAAGSRVPTYNWYGTGGNMTAAGARVMTNPGNPSFRAWKLDSLEEVMGDAFDGAFIDNTSFDHFIQPPVIIRGGAIAEYPTDPGTSYGTALLSLFADFSARFPAKAQVPNVSMYPDDSRVYPYVWGIYREGWNQPHRWQYYTTIEKNIADSTAAGVVANVMGGFAAEPRYEMPLLANYYLVKNDTCYFFPFLKHVRDEWGIDPRLNQWFDAVEYDVGQPLGGRYTLDVGIDPSSPLRDTMTATVEKIGYSYRLTDPSKSWANEQWQNLWVVFPSGYAIKAHHSGNNWIELYDPKEIPTNGVYRMGTYTYEVLAREYENALILMRPAVYGNTEVGDPSAAQVALPVTSENPSGSYLRLDRDGVVGTTPLSSISLRGADGAILIKQSGTAGSLLLHMSSDRAQATTGSVVTYTIEWQNALDTVARGAVVQSAVPGGTTYVAGVAEASGGGLDGGAVRWNLGDLPVGASGTVSFQVRLE